MEGQIDKRLVEEAINNIQIVKKIVDEQISQQVSTGIAELLIWGGYMLAAPILVTIFKSHIWWTYLLPVFFAIDMGRRRSVLPVLIYWTVVEVIFIFAAHFHNLWLFYASFLLIPVAFMVLKPRNVPKKKKAVNAAKFWSLTLVAGIIGMYLLLQAKAYFYIPLLWPFLITFSLGLLGSITDNAQLFWLGFTGTVIGPISFKFLSSPYKFWVSAIYGLIFMAFYFYMRSSLRRLQYGKAESNNS